jgi:prolyl oligopeptidase
MRKLATGVLIGLAACGTADAGAADGQDRFGWLEDVSGRRSMAWVEAHNAATEKELAAGPEYATLRTRLKTILDSKERIPYVSQHAGHVYNFWRDAGHVRGIWRRTTLDEFRKRTPAWETVIDLDRLAVEENENWVWAGAECLKPRGERCLVSLSRGGGDAHVVREFDLAARAFVKDGFVLPEAKGDASWIDRDTLFVATDFGAGSMTASGYPRIVKEWKRGTPLAQATLVYEARADDLSASAHKDFTPGFEREFVQRQVGFYSSELFVRDGAALVKVPTPIDANAFAVRDQLVIELARTGSRMARPGRRDPCWRSTSSASWPARATSNCCSPLVRRRPWMAWPSPAARCC